jgi:plastocyanin
MARRPEPRRGALALFAGVCSAALALVLFCGGVAAAGGGHVKIAGFAYHPKTLRIGKGTAVTWVNRDHTKHTATDPGVFNTGKLRRGEKATIRFKHRGTFRYICKIHPFMHGKIVVG